MGVVKVTTLLIKPESALGFSFEVRTRTEMKILCVKSMYMLKVVSSETNEGVKGLKVDLAYTKGLSSLFSVVRGHVTHTACNISGKIQTWLLDKVFFGICIPFCCLEIS